jgi:Glycosyltransferase family 87
VSASLPSMRERTYRLAEALWWAALPGSILFAVLQVTEHIAKGAIGFDAHAYWVAARMPETWYLLAPRLKDAYLYSPAFAQLLWPIGQLPWTAFQALWAAVGAALLFWLLKPLGWRKGLTLAPFFVTELMLGNVYILFAAALVLGLTRFPGAFAIFAVTKVAPSVVFLWFVVRREWGKAAVAVGTTAAIVVVSAAVSPHAWADWARFLLTWTGEGSVGAPVRAVLAIVVVVWAARTDRAWLLAPAVLLACPVFGGWGPLAVLAAIPRLLIAFPSPAAEPGSTTAAPQPETAVPVGTSRPA